ncbi:hypothetical protein [Oryza sativa Japonica Group]|uniref:Uncharacterized protein P0504E02.2 n=1 Tax=Oryza sativa subsp. japonica TaxID=39947 RepID=Q5JMK4_ORYSJ|nr:hypothetical protein [Oryza sativa Japonica Group]
MAPSNQGQGLGHPESQVQQEVVGPILQGHLQEGPIPQGHLQEGPNRQGLLPVLQAQQLAFQIFRGKIQTAPDLLQLDLGEGPK